MEHWHGGAKVHWAREGLCHRWWSALEDRRWLPKGPFPTAKHRWEGCWATGTPPNVHLRPSGWFHQTSTWTVRSFLEELGHRVCAAASAFCWFFSSLTTNDSSYKSSDSGFEQPQQHDISDKSEVKMAVLTSPAGKNTWVLGWNWYFPKRNLCFSWNHMFWKNPPRTDFDLFASQQR